MNFISNGEIILREFSAWKTKMQEAKLPLPTHLQIKQQLKKIKDLASKQYK